MLWIDQRVNTVLNSHQSEKWLLNKPTKYFRMSYVLSCIPKLQVCTNWLSCGETHVYDAHSSGHLNIVWTSKWKFFYSPTDAQVNCLKNNFKIYIKINMKKLRHISVQSVTPSSGSALLVLAKVTVVKIAFKICQCVVMWLHILVGPCWCVCVLHCSEVELKLFLRQFTCASVGE
jgi:hypothetical protein